MNFFKGFDVNEFSKQTNKIINDKSTVVVKSRDGTIREYKNITNPWKYIKKVKKEVNVLSAWIKTNK